MLIETSLFVDERDASSVPSAAGAQDPRGEVSAVGMARAERVMRVLDAVDALERRRRANDLVEALDRLRDGLDRTLAVLDSACDVQPADAPATWTPISTPLVPITAPVADPAGPAPVAARPVAPTPVAGAPVVPSVRASSKTPRRQAPAGLAAFVIAFPEDTD